MGADRESEILQLPHILGTAGLVNGQSPSIGRWDRGPDFRIGRPEQDSCFAIKRDSQQCALAFEVVPADQQAFAVWKPIDATQSGPSFNEHLAVFAGSSGTKENTVCVGTIRNKRLLRAIWGQIPVQVRIHLRRVCCSPTLQVKAQRFRASCFCDAIDADRRRSPRTLQIPYAKVLQNQAWNSAADWDREDG